MTYFSVNTNKLSSLSKEQLACIAQLASLISSIEKVQLSNAISSCCYDNISSALREISDNLEDKKACMQSMASSLETIATLYSKTEDSIINSSTDTGANKNSSETQNDTAPENKSGSDVIDEIIDMLDISEVENTAVSILVSILKWIAQIDNLASDVKMLDIFGDGLTISGLVLSIANDTLDNLNNGESINAIVADVVTDVAITGAEKLISTGCTALGEAVGSAIPVVGTIVGGVVGDAVGTVIGLGIDWATDQDFDGDGKSVKDEMSKNIENILDSLFKGGSKPTTVFAHSDSGGGGSW